jgi:hypothetical protein
MPTGRPTNPDLTKYWKVCIPATLAGTVELYLFDKIHKKPLYGARSKLITELLEGWVKQQQLLALAAQPNPGFINPDDVEERP